MFTNFLGVYSSERDHLKKLEDDLTKIKAEKEEADEKIERLSQLNEERNRLYDKQYEEKIAKVSPTVQRSPCSFALQVRHFYRIYFGTVYMLFLKFHVYISIYENCLSREIHSANGRGNGEGWYKLPGPSSQNRAQGPSMFHTF